MASASFVRRLPCVVPSRDRRGGHVIAVMQGPFKSRAAGAIACAEFQRCGAQCAMLPAIRLHQKVIPRQVALQLSTCPPVSSAMTTSSSGQPTKPTEISRSWPVVAEHPAVRARASRIDRVMRVASRVCPARQEMLDAPFRAAIRSRTQQNVAEHGPSPSATRRRVHRGFGPPRRRSTRRAGVSATSSPGSCSSLVRRAR
jgi:hypothetical protein